MTELLPTQIRQYSWGRASSALVISPKIYWKYFLTLLILLGSFKNSWAQSAANYSFATSTTGSLSLDLNGNVIDMSSGTTQLVAANQDNSASTVQTLPFSFIFMGSPYTQFSASSNGMVRLGSTVIGSGTYTISTGTAAAPIISAFGGDLSTGTSGKVHYKNIGTAPNRTLVVEFLNMALLYQSTPTNNGTYQVRLYESTGIIEFVYGAMVRNTGTGALNGQQVGIGFSAGSTAGSQAFIISATNTNTNNSATFTQQTYTAGSIPNLDSPTNGSQRTYTYTPSVIPNAPGNLTFSNIRPFSLTLNWTDNATNESGFTVYRSTDNINFSLVTRLASNTQTYTDNGLTPGTTYYYQIRAYAEALQSTPVTGNQATPALVPLNGTYTINQSGSGSRNFTSFTDAITSLNENGISGSVTFNVTAGQTFAENTPLITATGTSGNTITFQKSGAGANPIVSSTGTASSSDAGITIAGGDYFTFDGIDISIASGSALEYGYLIRNASATNGATNNTIRNSSITLNRANPNSIALLQTSGSTGGGVTPTNATGTNQNNTYSNLTIQNVYNGILLNGGSGTFLDNNNTVSGNIVGSTSANDLAGGSTNAYGIKASQQSNVKVFNNEIRNITTTSGTLDGIFIDLALGAAQVYNNKISNLAINSTTTSVVVTGMRLNTYTTNSGHSINAYNNMVTNLNHGFVGTASGNRRIIGIHAQQNGSGNGNTINVNYNSVRIEPFKSYTASSSAFEIGTTSGPVINVHNNIFANFMGAQSGAAKHYAWVSTSTATTGNTGSISNYNDLYIHNATNGFVGLSSATSSGGTDRATLADWQTATNQDANSLSVLPQFISASDLHASAPALNDAGTPIAGITTDIDGETRNATTPDIGADEFTPSSLDLGVTAFVSPGTSGCFSANENIEVTIKNFGTDVVDFSITPTTVEIVVSGALPQTISHVINTGSLAAGASLNVVAGTANMTAYGTYTFNASTITPGDGNSANDAMPAATRFLAPAVAQPLSVDFTGFTGTDLTTHFPGWYEATGVTTPIATNSNWINSATSQTTALGSATAKVNLYTTNRNEWIIGPKITATASTALKYKVAITDYNNGGVNEDNGMAGTDDKVQIMVSTDCGDTFTAIYTYNAANTTNITNSLREQIISLAAYAGQDIIIAFYATDGPIDNPNDYEFHLDDIFIGTPPSTDLSIASILNLGTGCGLTTQETISVTVSNFGSDAQTNIPLQYTINNGTPVMETMAGPLAPGATATYNFTTKADLSVAGTYTIAAATTMSADADAGNNGASRTITSIPEITSYPYLQNFENGAGGWATGGANNSWALGTPASTVINSAASGSNAWKTNLTGNHNNNEQSYVISPCFNFSTLVRPMIEMKVWWTAESGYDGAVLQSSIDGGTTWQNVGAMGDPDNWFNYNDIDGYPGGQLIGWTGTGSNSSNGWVTAKHELNGLGGNTSVRLRIAFGSDNFASNNGFAFDDISIYEKPENELQLVSITAPVSKSSGCGFTNAETVNVTVKNNGSTATSTFDLKYEVTNAAPVIETVNMVIAPGATGTYSFATKADMSVAGSYTFTATVIIPGDFDPSNNSSSKTINVSPTVATYPYLQDFENGAGGWTAGGSSASWALGTPAGTVINSAASGTQAWKTSLTGTYNNNEQSYVMGPCFNFSSLVKPTIELSIWWSTENSYDKAALQSSIDGGATWQHVGAFGDPNNWYNNNSTLGPGVGGGIKLGWSGEAAGATSGGWVTAKHDLTGLGGQSSVLLRIAFGSDGSTTKDGFAFDDILIKEGPALNMGAIALVTPLTTGCYSANEPVTVTIQNFGVAPIDFSINPTTVTVNITGASTATLNTTVTTGTLAAGTAQNIFVANLNMLTAGNYIFNATATVTGDGNTFNDAMPQVTRTVTPIAALPQVVDFNSFNGTNLTTGFPDWKEASGATKPSGTASAWTSAATTQATFLGSVTAKLNFTTIASTERQEWIVGPKVAATVTTALKLKAAVTSSGGNAVATMLPTDSLKIMVSADCGETFVSVGAITGNGNLTNALTNFIFDLSAYDGQNIIVALMGKTGTPRPTAAYDLHVDDLFLGTPPALDIDAVSIASLPTSGCYSSSELINVTILNNGSALLDFSINPVTVTVNVTGAVTQTLTTTINTGTLAAWSTQNVFVDNLNMRIAGGTYTFNGTATVAGDGNNSNDAMQTTSRTVIGLATLPQNVNFTGFTDANLTALFPGWREANGTTPGGTTSSWVKDDFGNVVGGVNGSSAKINLWNADDNVWIIGPKVNPTTTTELRFDLALTRFSNTNAATLGPDDEFKVMISVDCGSTYTAIRTYNASTPISNIGQTETINLSAYAGQDIMVAFFATEGSTGGSSGGPNDVDLFLDNIFIGDCTPGLWSGQVSTDWNTPGNWSCNSVPAPNANIIIPAFAKNYPQISSGIAQANNVTIATGASISINGGTLQVTGNLSNSGTFISHSGTLELTGLNGQVLSGITALANLTVNGSGTKTISGNLTINNALTMTSGLLNTESSKITLAGPATITESNNSYVLGQVETTRDLSAATMADFGGMGLQLTPAAGSVMPGLTTARRVTGTSMNAGGPGYSIPRYFDIQSAVNANLDVTMVFHYLDHEVSAYNEFNLVLYRSGNQGGNWAADSATVADPANNLVTLSGIAKFSYWTAGDINAPLPVELIAFNAVKKGNDALLTWTTASETNSKGFEVQVSSNSFDFRKLGFVESRNSSTLQQYSFTDAEKGKTGTRYYRLKQIDFDGTISYSSIRAVNFQTTTTLVHVYPNPFSATFNLTIESAEAAEAPATITDLTGKTVWKKQLKVEKGENQLKLDAAENLPAGIYLLHLQIGTEHFTTKLIKQ